MSEGSEIVPYTNYRDLGTIEKAMLENGKYSLSELKTDGYYIFLQHIHYQLPFPKNVITRRSAEKYNVYKQL